MSGRIPREFIDDLLVRVDIVDLINSHVPLKKMGSGHVARCPFHAEKSPSFSVNRNKQFYHCFGCGVGGNAISFLMEFSHLNFVEAIEDLAGFVGVDVPRESSSYSQKKEDYSGLYSILERVAVFYVEQLRNTAQGKTVIQYLKIRGISGETAKEFSLGYAPDKWDALASQFDNKLLLKAGMLTSKESKVFDRFRGRLIFPIRDKRKRVVAFGGRVLNDSLPKYLNSPETPVFLKGNELYGLFELLEKSSKPKQILLVEGYMDVLALSQFGISYSVAALGTAPSKKHMDLLFRFTAEIVFCFDGDAAGQKAAWRAVQEILPCLRDGRQARIMLIPLGEDPDSLIREKGVDYFEQKIRESQMLSDYFFEYLGSGMDLGTVEGRSFLASKAKPFIEKIPAGFFREMMLNKLKERSGIIQKPINSLVLNGAPSQPSYKKEVKSNNLSPARIAISLLLQNPQLIEIVEQKELDLEKLSFPGLGLLKEILHAIDKVRPKNSAILLESFRGKASEKTIKTLINWNFVVDDGIDLKKEFAGALDRLVEHANESIVNKLLLKEKHTGLTKDEKKQLLEIFDLSVTEKRK